MTRTSFMIGIGLSFCLHIALFVPWPGGNTPAPPTEPPDVGKVILAGPAATEEDTTPCPLPTPWPRQVAEPPEPPLGMREIIPAQTQLALDDVGDKALEEVPDDALPPLQIQWDGPEEARAVARALGMIIVVVDSRNTILGELTLSDSVRLVPSNARLDRFSNRVRLLPHGFFGTDMYREADRSIAAIWLLVPAGLDTDIADLQRDAIRERGLVLGDVHGMNGQFVQTPDGQYELRITNIRM